MDQNVTSRFSDLENFYTFLIDDLADKRTDNLPFLHSPMWPVSILLLYFGAVYIWVPNYMKNHKPFELRNFMIGYNLFQVVACYLLIRHFFKHGWTFDYLYSCKLPDYSNDSKSIGFMYGSYFNYVIKTIELIETVLFALRKKQSQISFLHVYHHACTFCIAWIFAKYVGGSMLTYTIIVNSTVHMFMYSYYLIAIFSKQLPFKLSGVKKFITVFQIVQLISILANVGFAMRRSCPMPPTLIFIYLPYMLILLSMFFSFYVRTYKMNNNALGKVVGISSNEIEIRKKQ
ncbi:elongation of very long chain fatty acids protein 4-like [Topomyia yanbarensis]|uniref:elongation of very long chain fatty acids protein 4-like n=1 Tax=Topomyia yanbarensis TaxID=2498891 RepID=UPI00273C5EB5|nr:elongation of very long chain fatty acids protein 4-like [Topomyia yanbarensis]